MATAETDTTRFAYATAFQQAMAMLDNDERQVDEDERRAREVLEGAASRRAMIAAQRDILNQSDTLIRRAIAAPFAADAVSFTIAPSSDLANGASDQSFPIDQIIARDEAEPSKRGQPRARIGGQRYRILNSLRTLEEMDRQEIAELTGLDRRRIKDQVSSDLAIGVVSEIDGKVRLTDLGLDLLNRFEASKKARGLPLPPLEGPITEDDREEADDTPQPEEAQSVEAM